VILQIARKQQPYKVREVEQHELFDMHKLSKVLNATQLTKAVHWMKVKCIRVTKGVTNQIEVKENYDDAYRVVLLRPENRSLRKRKGSTESNLPNFVPSLDASLLVPAYSHKIPVSVAKKSD